MHNLKLLVVSTLAVCSLINANTFFIENWFWRDVTVEFWKMNGGRLVSFTLSPGHMMDVTEQVGTENTIYKLKICRDNKVCIFLIPFETQKKITVSQYGEIFSSRPTAAMIHAAYLNRFHEQKILPFFVGLQKPVMYYENYDQFKQFQKIIAKMPTPHLPLYHPLKLQQLLASVQWPA